MNRTKFKVDAIEPSGYTGIGSVLGDSWVVLGKLGKNIYGLLY